MCLPLGWACVVIGVLPTVFLILTRHRPLCSGGALTCPADVARLVELTDPSASPLEVLSIMRTVQGRVDDLLQRLRQVQARVLRPLRAQRRRYPFAPAACGGLGEGEGEGFVDVVGMGSPGREQQQMQMQQLQEQQRQQGGGGGGGWKGVTGVLCV